MTPFNTAPKKEPVTPFTEWLSALLNESETQVKLIMEPKEPVALQFFIAWSLYESKCFEGVHQASKLRQKVDAFTERGFRTESIAGQVSHFHDRYQEKEGAKNNPDGHFKFPHLWPVKLPQAGRLDYESRDEFVAMREAASLSR